MRSQRVGQDWATFTSLHLIRSRSVLSPISLCVIMKLCSFISFEKRPCFSAVRNSVSCHHTGLFSWTPKSLLIRYKRGLSCWGKISLLRKWQLEISWVCMRWALIQKWYWNGPKCPTVLRKMNYHAILSKPVNKFNTNEAWERIVMNWPSKTGNTTIIYWFMIKINSKVYV